MYKCRREEVRTPVVVELVNMYLDESAGSIDLLRNPDGGAATRTNCELTTPIFCHSLRNFRFIGMVRPIISRQLRNEEIKYAQSKPSLCFPYALFLLFILLKLYVGYL